MIKSQRRRDVKVGWPERKTIKWGGESWTGQKRTEMVSYCYYINQRHSLHYCHNRNFNWFQFLSIWLVLGMFATLSHSETDRRNKEMEMIKKQKETFLFKILEVLKTRKPVDIDSEHRLRSCRFETEVSRLMRKNNFKREPGWLNVSCCQFEEWGLHQGRGV